MKFPPDIVFGTVNELADLIDLNSEIISSTRKTLYKTIIEPQKALYSCNPSLVLAVDGDNLVGGALALQESGRVDVVSFGVRADRRNEGIGSMLLRYVETYTIGSRKHMVSVRTYNAFPDLNLFLLKKGYHITGFERNTSDAQLSSMTYSREVREG